MKNLIIVENPLLKKDLTILRDRQTEPVNFRAALRRISLIMASEISKRFELVQKDIQTPLEKTEGYYLKHDIILVPVLRAGLSMLNAFLEIIPEAKVGHIGIQRNEQTLEPVDYYYKTPKFSDSAKVILLDPMLATGGSGAAAIKFMREKGAKDIIFACIVAAPVGAAKVNEAAPDVVIYSSALDRQLNDRGYILPGLGDAGDRTFGTF